MAHQIRAKIRFHREQLSELPISIIVLAGLLAITGIAFIHSASTNFNDAANSGLSHHAVKQLGWLAAGSLVFLIAALPDYRWTMRGRMPLYLFLAAVAMMIACMLFGREINGAKSWIVFGPISLQVSEFCKPLFILTLAAILRFRQGQGAAQSILLPLIALAVMLMLLLKQPDFGTAMIFIPAFLAMCWLSGASTKIIAALMSVGMLILPTLYLSGLFKSHQLSRIETWLAILTGAPVDRSGEAYQVTMSMNAIGSGGMFGRGYGNSLVSQGEFLPERHTDFIFSVLAEETGFAGAAAVVLLVAALAVACLWVGMRAQDAFGRLIAVGVGTALMTQALINIGMVCGLLPVTGLPLPLVSYGGSSLLATFACLGLVASVHLHPRRVAGLGGRITT